MKQYFSKFSYQNTELKDFMKCFQEAANQSKNVDIDLDYWLQSWLQTSGINTLTTVVEEREGGKYAVSIKQGLPQNGDKELYRE